MVPVLLALQTADIYQDLDAAVSVEAVFQGTTNHALGVFRFIVLGIVLLVLVFHDRHMARTPIDVVLAEEAVNDSAAPPSTRVNARKKETPRKDEVSVKQDASMKKQAVLFVCTHNSARSQMAEGLLRARAGDRYTVYSAGTEKTRVHPLANAAMQEMGIDLSGHASKTIDELGDYAFDVVVTVCDNAREACPYIPAKRENLHRSFADPSAGEGTHEERLAFFRRVRDEIAAWIDDNF